MLVAIERDARLSWSDRKKQPRGKASVSWQMRSAKSMALLTAVQNGGAGRLNLVALCW
jgi:hypothetical protein